MLSLEVKQELSMAEAVIGVQISGPSKTFTSLRYEEIPPKLRHT